MKLNTNNGSAPGRTPARVDGAAGVSDVMSIRDLDPADRNWASEVITAHFGSTVMVSSGTLKDTSTLPGLVAEAEGIRVGLLVYAVSGPKCEIVALVATQVRRGIARRLVEALESHGRQAGWKRLTAVTTNDNSGAIAFYQATGWQMVALHKGAVSDARRLKPTIPLAAPNGTPIEDELEFERSLSIADLSRATNSDPKPASATGCSNKCDV